MTPETDHTDDFCNGFKIALYAEGIAMLGILFAIWLVGWVVTP